MKAILLAAGMGTRLGAYTKDTPKCMLPFLDKPLLVRQVETLQGCGITDITVVTGYLSEKVQAPNIKHIFNSNYAIANMIVSLFAAEAELQGDVLVVYTDILYEPHLVMAAQSSHADIGVVVDDDYRDYWQNRLTDPQSDTESLVVDAKGRITSIGVSPCDPKEALARYVGIIKLSSKGIQILKNIYHKDRSLSKQFMTSLLQQTISEGHTVEAIRIKRGWLEFDTVSDYELYTTWAQENTLSRFFNV